MKCFFLTILILFPTIAFCQNDEVHTETIFIKEDSNSLYFILCIQNNTDYLISLLIDKQYNFDCKKFEEWQLCVNPEDLKFNGKIYDYFSRYNKDDILLFNRANKENKKCIPINSNQAIAVKLKLPRIITDKRPELYVTLTYKLIPIHRRNSSGNKFLYYSYKENADKSFFERDKSVRRLTLLIKPWVN